MLYAKVVVGLPVEGPFDYLIPQQMRAGIKAGSRVRVNFGYRKIIGYVAAITKKTVIKNIRPILELIDDNALLDAKMMRLTRELSDYYCCSWGEAIEAALPQGLRQGRKIAAADGLAGAEENNRENNITLAHIPDAQSRWEIYFEYIKKTQSRGRSVIILLPDMQSLQDAARRIQAKLRITPLLLYRKQPGEINVWCAAKESDTPVIVMGIRSVVFAPLKRPGLIIVDEEENFVYKQDQAPHYHARDVALMRAKIDKADVVLGSASPSLEAFYLAREKKACYIGPEAESNFPEVKIVDTRNYRNFIKKKKVIFSKFLEDAVFSALSLKEKVLLFLNRKGFATLAVCGNCGSVLKCPRCSINLVYHLKDDGTLRCHYCNFKMPAPKICPNCNCGYIKYSGAGTEKIEKELACMFASAVIKRAEGSQGLDLSTADIFVAASAVIRQAGAKFAVTGILSIDNSLNHADLRSSEKVFRVLAALTQITDKIMVIQTALPLHHCFQALLKKEPAFFYEEELSQRKELCFPPYGHLVLVKLRGRKEERIKRAAEALFEKLSQCKERKGIKILSLNPGSPSKLRDNFYWQILLNCASPPKAGRFLKFNLKNFPHSGIIVTVDVDPPLKMNIIFFGSDNFATAPLEALVGAGYRISCVVTQPDRAGGRGLKLEATPVKALAIKTGLEVYQPGDVNSTEALSFLKGLNADLFIVIAYGQILSQEVINIPKIFAINAHASMLPKYRGAAPINWAIIKGERSSGVSIIKIVRELDAGPVIKQQAAAISDDDTAVTLQDKLSLLAAGLLLDSLAAIKNNSYKLLPQGQARATLAPKLKKSDGRINWESNARDIYNLIRGCFDWPGAFTYYHDKVLKIHKAKANPAASASRQAPGTVLEASKSGILVAAREGCLLIEQLQLEGKRIMKAGEFISGNKITAGESLGGKK